MTIEDLIKKHSTSFRERDLDANKGTYGKLLIIAGSPGMAGAAFLAGLAAFRCGIGMIRYFGPEENRVILQNLLPEAMYESYGDSPGIDCGRSHTGLEIRLKSDSASRILEWADYVILGPGIAMSDTATKLVKALFDEEIARILREKQLVVIDADGLNIIAREGLDVGRLANSAGSNIAVTPHIVEMQRLVRSDLKRGVAYDFTEVSDLTSVTAEDIKENAEKISRFFSQIHSCLTVLKDSVTTVAAGDSVYRIDVGSGAMAKAGAGDVLTGFLCGATVILHGDTLSGIPLGVYLHGLAGTLAGEEKGAHSILSRDIADMAGEAMRKLQRERHLESSLI